MYLMSHLCSGKILELMLMLTETITPTAMLDTVSKGKLEMRTKLTELKNVLPEGVLQKADVFYKDYKKNGNHYPEYSGRLLKKFRDLVSIVNKDLYIEQTRFHHIDEQVEALIAPYDKDFKTHVRTFTRRILTNIINPGKEPKRVRPLFISGPPGIGKTRFVEKLSNIIGIACIKRTLTNLENNDLTGSDSYESDVHKNGLIIDSLIEASRKTGVRDAVLFLDEIQAAFKANDEKSSEKQEFLTHWLLDNLNTDTLTTHAKAYNIDINIDRLIIVIAGTEDFTHENIALKSRIDMVELKPLSPESKRDIVKSEFSKRIKAAELSFDEKDEAVIGGILKCDKNPGVRVALAVIDEYIDNRKQKQLFNQFFKVEDFNVSNAYRKHYNEDDIKATDVTTQTESFDTNEAINVSTQAGQFNNEMFMKRIKHCSFVLPSSHQRLRKTI